MPIDQDLQTILDQLKKFNPQPLEKLSPDAARNNPTLKNAVEEFAAEHLSSRLENIIKPIPEPVGDISHILIPTDKESILARVYTPQGEGPFPVLVYFHGGGWVIANLDVYESSCRSLCNAIECIVVSVAYRLAPEAKYPAATEDAYAATQWVIENASQLNGDSQRVAIAGESAGGNLAAVTCLKTRDKKGKMPIAQLLIYPVTDSRLNTPSMKECVNTVPLYTAMMAWFWNQYVQNEEQKLEPYASPLLASDLSGLPPAIVITAEYDPLRDEGEEYAKRLAEAGVQVSSKRYDGMVHEFFGLSGVVNKAKEALEYAAQELKQIFNK